MTYPKLNLYVDKSKRNDNRPLCSRSAKGVQSSPGAITPAPQLDIKSDTSYTLQLARREECFREVEWKSVVFSTLQSVCLG